MDSPIYITGPYFQTKTIQILLKHIEYITITNFINNLMNIMHGDLLKIINTMLHTHTHTHTHITLLQIQFIS